MTTPVIELISLIKIEPSVSTRTSNEIDATGEVTVSTLLKLLDEMHSLNPKETAGAKIGKATRPNELTMSKKVTMKKYYLLEVLGEVLKDPRSTRTHR